MTIYRYQPKASTEDMPAVLALGCEPP